MYQIGGQSGLYETIFLFLYPGEFVGESFGAEIHQELTGTPGTCLPGFPTLSPLPGPLSGSELFTDLRTAMRF